MKELTIEVGLVTPQIAQALMSRRYIHQRPIRDAHVVRLSNEIKSGRWVEGIGRLLTGSVRGVPKIFVLDGQHRLCAIVEAGTGVPMVQQHLVFDTDGEMREYYSLLGRKALPEDDRSTADSIAPFLDMTGISRKAQGSLKAATAWATVGFPHVVRPFRRPSEESALIGAMTGQMRQLMDACKGGTNSRKITENRATVALACITIRYEWAQAIPFWNAIAHDTGDAGSPARRAANYIVEARTGRSAKFEDRRQIEVLATLWGYHLEGRKSIQKVSPRGDERGVKYAPLLVKGTAYDGNRTDWENLWTGKEAAR